ncbi:PREDICTED: uncharacterized protein LOC107100692 [Cyprinodon variegatus]|uniref:uncharacterized protein LOC107100692 n=1 Tax=Cyprinodon variegatus TaxID=28743 RepID=UPI000742A33C|nr:PREDICTED: uncharacterized protein LOC107100692 [Cyprinodon variegatus]
MLIYGQSPVYSIDKIQSLEEKTAVSVEGTVTEIIPVKKVKVTGRRAKVKITRFHLKDETGSIWITLWSKDSEQLKGKSVGDFVRVINTKTHRYYEMVSLNSTDFTRIITIQEADVQNVTIQVVGIIGCNQEESELDVEINEQVQTCTVASPLLAKVLGINLKDDFEDKLLEKTPISAEAEIKGNKIIQLKLIKEEETNLESE